MIILLPCNDHVFPLEMSRSHYVIGYRADHVISDLIGIGHYIPIRDRIYKYMYINSHYFFYHRYVVVQSQTVRHHFAAVTLLVEF